MTSGTEAAYSPGDLTGDDGYGKQFFELYDTIFPQLTGTEIDWLSAQIRNRQSPTVLEFGVGTGRVLVPLADRLRTDGIDATLVGVDASPEMLSILTKHESPTITPRLGNMRNYRDGHRYDLVLCVCGSMAILTSEAAQQEAMRTFAEHLAPGGLLITQTHNPQWVQALDQHGGSHFMPYPGVRRGMVIFSELTGERWTCKQIWIDDEDIRVFKENALLISQARLLEMADAAGLQRVTTVDGLTGTPFDPVSSMTMVTVFERKSA